MVLYILFQKYVNILALEVASSGSGSGSSRLLCVIIVSSSWQSGDVITQFTGTDER